MVTGAGATSAAIGTEGYVHRVADGAWIGTLPTWQLTCQAAEDAALPPRLTVRVLGGPDYPVPALAPAPDAVLRVTLVHEAGGVTQSWTAVGRVREDVAPWTWESDPALTAEDDAAARAEDAAAGPLDRYVSPPAEQVPLPGGYTWQVRRFPRLALVRRALGEAAEQGGVSLADLWHAYDGGFITDTDTEQEPAAEQEPVPGDVVTALPDDTVAAIARYLTDRLHDHVAQVQEMGE